MQNISSGHTPVLPIDAVFWMCQLALTFKELNIKCCVMLLLKKLLGLVTALN